MRPLLALSAVIAVAVVVVLAVRGEDAPPERAAATARPASLLAVAGEGEERRLVRVDPVSLRPIGSPTARLTQPGARRSVPLAAPLEGWASSPGGSQLAAVTDRGAVVRLFDVARMRSFGRLRTRARGAVATVLWTRPDRIWVVLARPGCCALGSTTVVVLDPVARRVVARRLVGGGLARMATTADGPVLLLAPSNVIGPGTLATVDGEGRVDEVRLVGMSAGVFPTEGLASVERVRAPGLAVDPVRRRAFVFSHRPHAVEVDLTTGEVRNHRLVPRPSLTDRVRELVDPAGDAPPDRSVPTPPARPNDSSPVAAGSGLEPPPDGVAPTAAVVPPDTARGGAAPAAAPRPRVGRTRTAAWIGAARVAVSGNDEFVVLRGGEVEAGGLAAGLRIVDTRDWSFRIVDETVDGFRTAAGLLLAGGSGLAAYAPDGKEVFRLLEGSEVEIVGTAGSLAYVRADDALKVIDLAEGRVLATPSQDRPRLVLELGPRGW